MSLIVTLGSVTRAGKQPIDGEAKSTTRNARNAREFRERLQKDPEEWAKFKAAEATRLREYRKRRSEDQKDRDKETGKNRQKRLYKRKKEEHDGSPTRPSKKAKVMTRSEKEKLTDYNRVKKRESRSRRTPQLIVAQKKKDAKRKRDARAAKKKKKELGSTPQVPQPPATGFLSKCAQRMALSRIWARFPKDPLKFAAIIEDFIVKKATPRKQASLEARGLVTRRRLFLDEVATSLKSKVKTLKKKKDKQSLRDRQILVGALISKRYRRQKMLAQELDVRANYISSVAKQSEESLNKTERKKRKDATCLVVVQNILDYYKDGKVSRPMPYMRAVKDQTPKATMEVSVAKAHDMWKVDNPEYASAVGFETFRRLRPKSVLLQRKTRLNQCLCEICTDIMLKLQALNRAVILAKMNELQIRDKHELIELTMCPKEHEQFCRHKCIYRTCQVCGIFMLKERLSPLCEQLQNKMVEWRKWEVRSYEHDGKIKKKKVLITKRGRVPELVEELINETVELAKHIFVAHWQHNMFVQIRTHLPDDWALFVLDFAENYTCLAQDEIQSAHWATDQVTVHPLVVYYNCKHNDTSHIAQEALVFISNDLQHDSHAVHHFETVAMQYLKDIRGLTLSRIVEFTDGCSCQYKSRGPFADLSFAEVDHGVKFERQFFGSRHGKGPSDGVSGTVKNAVRLAVTARRTVVNEAVAMYNFCSKNLVRESCAKQRRSFFFVKKGDINRDRPEREVKTALSGTRVLHAVRTVEPGVLDTRLLGCFCEGCVSPTQQSHCSNATYVMPWQKRVLKMMKEPPTKCIVPEVTQGNNTTSNIADDQVTINDLWKTLQAQGKYEAY
jgi:hypothetical protein